MQQVGCPRKLRCTHPGRLGAHAFELVRGVFGEQAGIGGIGHRLQNQQIADPLQQVHGEPAGIVSGRHHLLDNREGTRWCLGRQRLDGVVEDRDVRQAEQCRGPGGREPFRTGPGDQLVEYGEAVANRAGTGAYDERQDRRLDYRAFVDTDLGQKVPQDRRGDQAKCVVVGTRADRLQDLVRLGGGEDELQMLRGLFDQLEQRVERV